MQSFGGLTSSYGRSPWLMRWGGTWLRGEGKWVLEFESCSHGHPLQTGQVGYKLERRESLKRPLHLVPFVKAFTYRWLSS
jgi:hypothetical protein